MGYRFLEHTADVMIEAYGRSVGETFSFAAKGMFDVMLDLTKVAPQSSVKIEVSANDLEGLLYSWLEELLFRFGVDGMAFSEFNFDSLESKGVVRGFGVAKGEPYDARKHSRRIEVKAITYGEMLITKTCNGVKARFILDI